MQKSVGIVIILDIDVMQNNVEITIILVIDVVQKSVASMTMLSELSLSLLLTLCRRVWPP